MEPRLVGFDGEIGQGIRFVDVPNTQADSLIIRVRFEDGDGNLGVSSRESNPILSEPIFYPLDNQGNYIRFNAATDVFDCRNWDPVTIIDGDTINDTIRIEFNPNFLNFEIDLYVKEESGYELFDFRAPPICRQPLGGQFPPLKDNFENTKPLEGVIQYGFSSVALINLFRNDSLKIAVRIRDRALNVSNTIESEAFTLRDAETDTPQ
ncbi:MAG: hypothetical protein ACLFUB_13370 [Cyclobacteriaceae bacterium]